MRMSILAATLGGTMAAVAAPVLAQQPAPAQQSAPAPSMADENPVVATVDGTEIRLQDMMIALEKLPQQYRNAPLDMIYTQLLQQMVQRRLVAMAAQRSTVVDDPNVQRRIAFARDEILAQSYLGQQVDKAVTPETVKARYDAELADAPRNEEVRARHILVESLEEAEAVLVELRGGADFAEAAKKHSTGPSGSKGGELGFFAKDAMVPEFSEAAFKMQPGEISKPVKTQFGWHVIKVEERRAGEPASFEERAGEIRQAMSQEVVRDILQELESAAKIEAFAPDGEPLNSEAEPKAAE